MLCPQRHIALTLDRHHTYIPGKSPDTFRDEYRIIGNRSVPIKTRPLILPLDSLEPLALRVAISYFPSQFSSSCFQFQNVPSMDLILNACRCPKLQTRLHVPNVLERVVSMAFIFRCLDVCHHHNPAFLHSFQPPAQLSLRSAVQNMQRVNGEVGVHVSQLLHHTIVFHVCKHT